MAPTLVLALTLALALALALALSDCRGSCSGCGFTSRSRFAFDSLLSRALPCALSHDPALAVSGSALDQITRNCGRSTLRAPTATWEDRKLRWIQPSGTEIERL